MALLRLALPTALVLWFLWKARGNTLFLLGIPVLMVMRGSVFFEKMKPFWTPGRLDSSTLLMGWLFLVWVVTLANERSRPDRELRPPGGARVLPEELPLIGIAVMICWHALRAFGSSGDLAEAVSLADATFYIVLGYILVRGIAKRATRAETEEFLASVVIVNTIAAAMFILHQGLHLPIYEGESSVTSFFAGQDVTRATTFAPVLTLLALGFVLGKRRWSLPWLVVLAITTLSVLVSLTRTLLIAAAVGYVIAIVARELTRPEASRVLRRAATVVLGAAVVIVAFSRITPGYWTALLQRLSEFTSGTAGAQVPNWHIRVVHWTAVERVVARSDLLLGLGFPQPASNPVDSRIFLWSSDMTWLPIMYRFGYVGLVLFGLLLAGFMARALWLSLRPPELRRELALAYFITIVLTVIMGFQMWTFMMPIVYPMGLWIFALAAAEALRPAEGPDVLPAPADQPAKSSHGDHRPHPRST